MRARCRCQGKCEHRLPRPSGGWRCRYLAEETNPSRVEEVADLGVALPAPGVERHPNTEYLRVAIGPDAARSRCWCPRIVLGNGRGPLRIDHVDGCDVRHLEFVAPDPPPPHLPRGARPCPACGKVAWSVVAGGRRCDGPGGCGLVSLPVVPCTECGGVLYELVPEGLRCAGAEGCGRVVADTHRPFRRSA